MVTTRGYKNYWKNTDHDDDDVDNGIDGENNHLRFNEIGHDQEKASRPWGAEHFPEEYTNSLDYPNNQAKIKVSFISRPLSVLGVPLKALLITFRISWLLTF